MAINVKTRPEAETQIEHVIEEEIEYKKPTPVTKMTRVSVDISPQFNNQLSYLSDKLCVSKAEVLKKAFILLDAVIEATDGTGKKFGVANKDQTLETEFIRLW